MSNNFNRAITAVRSMSGNVIHICDPLVLENGTKTSLPDSIIIPSPRRPGSLPIKRISARTQVERMAASNYDPDWYRTAFTNFGTFLCGFTAALIIVSLMAAAA